MDKMNQRHSNQRTAAACPCDATGTASSSSWSSSKTNGPSAIARAPHDLRCSGAHVPVARLAHTPGPHTWPAHLARTLRRENRVHG